MDDQKPTVSSDAINHPGHYNAGKARDGDGTAKFEAIKLIEDWGVGRGFCIGNAIKYILRAPHKGDPTTDLEKAAWYLERSAYTRSVWDHAVDWLRRKLGGISLTFADGTEKSALLSVRRFLKGHRLLPLELDPMAASEDWDLPPYLDVALQLIVDGENLEALEYVRKEIDKYNAPGVS